MYINFLFLLFFYVHASNYCNRRNTNVNNKTSEQQPTLSLLNSTIATYYFRVGDNVDGCADVQTFNDGNGYGACNNNLGVKYSFESKYWAAIKNGNLHCGEKIMVKYKNNSIVLTVFDKCIACEKDNHIDMGLEALIELTGSKNLACAINTILPVVNWDFI
jgi:hypothetical protein